MIQPSTITHTTKTEKFCVFLLQNHYFAMIFWTSSAKSFSAILIYYQPRYLYCKNVVLHLGLIFSVCYKEQDEITVLHILKLYYIRNHLYNIVVALLSNQLLYRGMKFKAKSQRLFGSKSTT